MYARADIEIHTPFFREQKNIYQFGTELTELLMWRTPSLAWLGGWCRLMTRGFSSSPCRALHRGAQHDVWASPQTSKPREEEPDGNNAFFILRTHIASSLFLEKKF